VKDVVRLGLIGAGTIGRVHADNLARRVEGARLVAVADINRAAAEACAAACGAEAFASDAELVARPDIDAVAICTPPETHAAIIEAAAAAGKHVFCEKPLERTPQAADRAIAAAEKAKVKLFVAFNRRFDPHFLHLRDAVLAGRIGRPLLLHFVARDPVTSLGNLPRPAGDLFLSTTIHELDFAGFLLGAAVKSVYATGGVFADGATIDDPDTAVTVLRFAGGVSATLDNSRVSAHGYDQRIEAYGTGGMITAGNLRGDDTRTIDATGDHRAGAMDFFADRYRESYIAEMAAFARCVLKDTPPPVTPAEARTAQVLAHAAHRSYVEGRVLAVSEFR
jgi:myo-inositol 2-dehydrogenase/D-chiro-inositol 1-dehydrogenase